MQHAYETIVMHAEKRFRLARIRDDNLSFRENSIKTRSDSGLTMASKHWAALLDVMPPMAEFVNCISTHHVVISACRRRLLARRGMFLSQKAA